MPLDDSSPERWSPMWMTSTIANCCRGTARGSPGTAARAGCGRRSWCGRRPCGQLAPGVQHLGGALDREERRAGVDRRQVESSISSAVMTPNAPPPPRIAQNRSGSGAVGADELAVGGDDLGREDAVGAQAVAAGEEADAAAERVADDADVVRGAGESGEAVLPGRADDVAPQRAGLDAGDAVGGVDLHAAHLVRLDESVSLRSPSGEALWPVPWAATRRPSRLA